VPFGERHSLERLGLALHITVRLGLHADPGHHAEMENCGILGFASRSEHVHYFIAHEIIVRVKRTRPMRALRSRCSRS